MEKKWSWRRAEVSSSQKGYSKFSIVINAEKVASRRYFELKIGIIQLNNLISHYKAGDGNNEHSEDLNIGLFLPRNSLLLFKLAM